jgi:predicted nuclease of predicted toxin-antitoxin system
MNLTPRWVPFLRDAGHDTVHWSSVGRISAKDIEIFDFAR